MNENGKHHGAPERLLQSDLDWGHGQKLLQNFIEATGDFLLKNPMQPMIDPGNYHTNLKRAFLAYNAWLSKQ